MSDAELGDEQIIRSSVLHLGGAAVLCLAFGALGALFVRDAYSLGDRYDEEPGYIGGIGLAALVLGVSLSLFQIICCLPGANYLRLTREGFICKTPFKKRSLVRWTWVRLIDPADKGSMYAGVDVLFRAYVNAPMQTITIASLRFGMSPRDIAEILAAWRERAASKPSPASKHVERESP